MKKRKILITTAIIVLIILFSLLFMFVGKPLIQFVSKPDDFREWVNQNGLWGKAAFIGMMALQVIVAVIPGEPFEIGAGYAFGALEGTILCLAGAMLGSVIVFYFVRKFGVKAVEVFFPRKNIDSIGFLKNTKKLNFWVFIMLFIPGTPKDILTYCVGLTKMKFTVWLSICGIARIPSIITSTIGGDALGMGNSGFAILIFIITFIISAAGLLVYRKICTAQTPDDNTGLHKVS